MVQPGCMLSLSGSVAERIPEQEIQRLLAEADGWPGCTELTDIIAQQARVIEVLRAALERACGFIPAKVVSAEGTILKALEATQP